MTTRVGDSQIFRTLSFDLLGHREKVNRYSEEISTGLKVFQPGDTERSSVILQFQQSVKRVDAYKNVIASTESLLRFQENALNEAHELLIRASELAQQGANETLGTGEREQIAVEIFEIRDAIVSLANSTYQGRYIWNGSITNTPPYNDQAYANPATGPESERYVFDATIPGAVSTQSVAVTDSLEIRTNTPANQVWDNAIASVERLGRALAGFATDVDLATNPPPYPPFPPLPTGAGAAYTFPADFQTQTQEILHSLDLLDAVRENDIQQERTNLGGRLTRLENARSLIELSKEASKEALGNLQEADITESATNLSLAQTALEASLTVTTRVLNLTILDFI